MSFLKPSFMTQIQTETHCKINYINFESQLLIDPNLVVWDLIAMDILTYRVKERNSTGYLLQMWRKTLFKIIAIEKLNSMKQKAGDFWSFGWASGKVLEGVRE